MPRLPKRQVLLKVRRVRSRKDEDSDETPDYYVVLLAARYLRPAARGRVLMLCDVEREISTMIDCGGRSIPLHIVLKIYAKMTPATLKAQRDRERYQRLLDGKLNYTND